MLFTKKSQLFWQGFPRLILVVTFISWFTSDCFAGAPKVLSDEELDNVQAEGLYFDFDVSFGDLNNLAGSQDIKLFNIPAANLNLGDRKEDAVIPADVINKIKALIAPYMVYNIAISDNAALESTPAESTPLASTPATTTAPLDTTPAPSAISQSLASEAVSLSVPGITATAQPENVSVSTSQSSAANNILPAASTSVTQPSPSSSSDVLRLDITAGGKDSANLTAASFVPANMLPLTANNGSNIVNVSDYSQQYLSSLVNVNAAGSIVPVMLNITVNINSNIGTISNNNTLDLRNYYRFQLH